MSDQQGGDNATGEAGAKAKRRGLGRGLGALIPSGPLPSAANKGHFWDALDHPPIVDVDRVDPLADPPATPPADVQDDAPGDRPVDDGSAESAGQSAPETVVPNAVPAVDNPAAVLVDVPLDAVVPNARQPRQVFDEEGIEELTHSIREFGLLQPIVVRRLDEGTDGTDGTDRPVRYELVMGERRLRAARAAGLTEVPAILRRTADDAMLRDALLENIHRVQLNPLEEAAAYDQLLADFAVTHEQLAERIGRSRSQVSNTIRLLRLPVPVQQRVAAGVLSAGHARALLGLPDSDAQERLAKRIVAEGLSVRATEEAVSVHEDSPATRRTPRTGRITAPALDDLAGNLSDAFDTRVQVQLGRRKGKVTIEFASVDDLERIVGIMAPHLATKRGDQG